MSTHDQTISTGFYDLPVVPKPRMTEDEFVTWSLKEDVRAEWLDGEIVVMSPVNKQHTALFLWLSRLLGEYVERHDLGTIWGSELFVRLPNLPSRRLPDLFFVASDRQSLLMHAHFEGAPDMIMEIASPESVARDWDEKYRDYEAAGVREYWIIDPTTERAELYVLSNEPKFVKTEPREGWLNSSAVLGFRLKIEWLWSSPLPKVGDALRELDVSAV